MDVVVAGSQKALMAPPGLSFASPTRPRSSAPPASLAGATTSNVEWTVSGQLQHPPDSPFTPAVGLIKALDVALEMIEREGLDRVYERHALLGCATREAARR